MRYDELRMSISRICLHILVDSQVVRHCTLTAIFVGSNPTPPANGRNGNDKTVQREIFNSIIQQR